MFTSSRRARLVAAALRPLVAAKYPIALPDEYRYAHLSLALIDTIYSIGARYEGTHATVLRYARHQQLSPYHDAFDTRPPLENQEPLSHLVQLYHALGIETMMTDVYQIASAPRHRVAFPKPRRSCKWRSCFNTTTLTTSKTFSGWPITSNLNPSLKPFLGSVRGSPLLIFGCSPEPTT